MENKDQPFFAPPAEVDIREVDAASPEWGPDAKEIAREAGLGSYDGTEEVEGQLAETALDETDLIRRQLRWHRTTIGFLIGWQLVETVYGLLRG